MKKLKLPARPSAAVEILRDHLRQIYAPTIRMEPENGSVDLTTDPFFVNPEEVLFTARSVALELQVPLSRILKVVHRGQVRPMAKTTAGGWLFSKAQLASIKTLLETK